MLQYKGKKLAEIQTLTQLWAKTAQE